MVKEIWKDIPEYAGLYQVSNIGRVKSLPFPYSPSEMILSPRSDGRGKGYLFVSLRGGKPPKNYKIHCLVMLVFKGPRPKGKVINHIDGNTLNNCDWNLEYCTQKENVLHAWKTGLCTPNKYKGQKDKIVLQYNLDGTFIKEWESVKCAYDNTVISNISAVCRGERHIAGGFIWKYKEKK